MRRFSSLVFVIVLAAPAAVLAGQQPPPPQQRPRAQQPGGDLSPGEVQRLFDAYALVQAQEALGLDNEQYGRFVSAMKGLQETRRRNQQERARLLRELNRLSGPDATADEAALVAALGQLASHDEAAAADLQGAYAQVDAVLSPRQRARFRLFEENMERRKIDLLMRARQANRGRGRPSV